MTGAAYKVGKVTGLMTEGQVTWIHFVYGIVVIAVIKILISGDPEVGVQ